MDFIIFNVKAVYVSAMCENDVELYEKTCPFNVSIKNIYTKLIMGQAICIVLLCKCLLDLKIISLNQ